MSDKNTTSPKGVVALGTVTTTAALDASKGNLYTVTLGGNITAPISNVRPGEELTVCLLQDGTGNRTCAFTGGTQTVTAPPSAASLVAAVTAAFTSNFVFIGVDATTVRLKNSQLGA